MLDVELDVEVSEPLTRCYPLPILMPGPTEAKKRAEKERLMRVFEDVAEQKRQKEIEKLKIAEEDKRAAKLYEEMVNKAEEARASYFIRKTSDNESMAKALDEVFGKRDRERAAKEKATLERIVKEEDERLKYVIV